MPEQKDPKDPKEPKRSLKQKVEAFAAGQQVQKLQAHLKKHKREYLIGGGCLVVGYLLRRPHPIAPVFNNMIDNAPKIAPVFNNDNSSTVAFGGYSVKIVKRLSDGQMWEKVTEAAAAAGKPVSVMSRHLHDYPGYETLDGEVYKIIGLGTTG